MIGMRFGRWVVLDTVPGTKEIRRRALCRCDCGTVSLVIIGNLRRGLSTGCRRHQKPRKPKHGHATRGSPEYSVWSQMLSRCNNPRASNWERYGGQGISVCERWRDFRNFLSDMGPRPPKTSLDRRDNTRGYEPANCRWATAREQAENRSTNHNITIDGETRTLTAWARFAGISDTAMLYRIRRGMAGRDLLRAGHHGKALEQTPTKGTP